MSRKRHLWHLQHGLCFYCQTEVAFEEATLDHFVPISRGGLTKTLNLVMACEDCNVAKSDFDPKNVGAHAPRCSHPQNIAGVKRLRVLVMKRQLHASY